MEVTFEKIVTLVIILNVIAYLIKFILKSKGYPVNWFYRHFRDLPNIWRLYGKTQNFGERLLYFLLGTIFPVLVIIFIYAAFLQISSMSNTNPCVYQENFRNRDWNGIVINKYIDKPNHAFKTIEIKNHGQIQKIQNWVLFQSGNYEKIELGDSIVKKQGLIYVSLYKPDTVIQLEVDYGCKN